MAGFEDLASFFFPQAPTGPTNYPAMEARRRMALTLMAANARKGYPKNIGEGLSAIGDAIGERGMMNQLMRQEASYQKQADEAAKDAVPAEARTPAPAAAKPLAYAEPDETQPTETDPMKLAADTPPPQPPAEAPPEAAPPPQQVADYQPPAPRDRVASMLLNGRLPTAPVVPQANPTLPGASAPALPTTPMPSAAAAGGQQPDQRLAALTPPGVASDVGPVLPGAVKAPPQVQLAQAAAPPGGLPQVKAPLTDLPQRQVPPPVQIGAPPARLPIPSDVPMSDDEKRGYRLRAKALSLGDPFMQKQAEGLIQYGAAQRQQEYQARVKDWQDAMLARREKEIADEAFKRGEPQRELERQQAEVNLAKSKQFGGLSEEAVISPVKDSAKAVAGIPSAAIAVRNAAKLVPEMYSGATGDVNLTLHKMLAAAGFPADPRIQATEQFKALIMPVVAAARQAQSGGANISDNDMKLALAAAGGNITLSKDSIAGILGALQRLNTQLGVWHQNRVEAAAGDDPQRQAFMFKSYGLPMESIVDPKAIEFLKQNPTPELMQQFNSKYHTPGLAQKILGGG